MRRGEIWWADLPAPRGSEPGFRRPVLILQDDDFNRSNLRTIIVASISSNLQLASAPGNVLLKKKQSRLKKDSVINVSQILALDKSYFCERVGVLPSDLLEEVRNGLKLILSI